jgi:hypothetical protein
MAALFSSRAVLQQKVEELLNRPFVFEGLGGKNIVYEP